MSTRATPEDVKRLAALARIEVADADLARFAEEFDGVLSYIGTLEELTLPEAAAALPTLRNVLRADEGAYEAGAWTSAIAAQFPEREGGALKVKQIISHD